MRQPTLTDYSLLVFLGVVWASAFFNIKLATDSFGPITIAFIRVLLGSLPLIILCFYKNIKIEVFGVNLFSGSQMGNLVPTPFTQISNRCQ